MTKAEVLDSLNQINKKLKSSRASLNRTQTEFISKQTLKTEIQNVATIWFENIEMQLTPLKFEEKTIKKFHGLFEKLLKLSLTNSRKKSYVVQIDKILKDFNSELLVNAIKSSPQIDDFKKLDDILPKISKKESEYLKEAIGCANNQFFRASVVLGWSAAIHRIHKTIEQLGFDIFNQKSDEMKNIDSGRYRRFNKLFNVHNIAELQSTVFDNDLLWILEYWGLIDSNQHDRLTICFTMRNNSGHPGEATISPENLLSFYSDLEKIVFTNPNFPIVEND